MPSKMEHSEPMRSFHVVVDDSSLPDKTISLAGRLSVTNAHLLLKEILDGVRRSAHENLTLDLSRVDYMDSAAVAVLLDIERATKAAGKKFFLEGLTGDIEGLLSLIDRGKLTELTRQKRPRPESIMAQVGGGALHVLADAKAFIVFVGDATIAMAGSIFHPGSVRWRETFFYMDRSGADALPIVGLISLLIGLILGFQALTQLKQFGANIYAADLVGLSVLRELGPLMTCILVAGRSGSAFAAEIGTMKVSEEVDALTTMGFDPVRFLVVPKVLALMLMVPLLTIYSDFLGVLGGMFVGTTMGDLTVSAYVLESYKTIHLWDIGQGLIKCEAYAIIVSLVGCMRGFQARGGAASVGQYTTSAVVTGIFLIIVADAVFTLIFQYYS